MASFKLITKYYCKKINDALALASIYASSNSFKRDVSLGVMMTESTIITDECSELLKHM